MKGLSLANIASACGGTYRGSEDARNREITGVAIDSRKIEKDFLFVPIKGARVDGHDFIEQVMEKEALCTLSEHPLTGAQYPYILVNSTEQALKDLAHFYRSQLDLKVIGITGSVGKTSTKELIASVLEQKYRVLKTEGNYNNEIGLPLTIFRLTEEDEIAVLEMGIDHFGEMHRLADIARPNVCVITNIGYAHPGKSRITGRNFTGKNGNVRTFTAGVCGCFKRGRRYAPHGGRCARTKTGLLWHRFRRPGLCLPHRKQRVKRDALHHPASCMWRLF